MSASLEQGYQSCRDVTRHHARSFYLASHALDARRRRAAYAVYAFCRRVDDAIDEAEDTRAEVLHARVAMLRERLDSVYSFAVLRDEQCELMALRDTVRCFGIERKPFDELIDGVALDVSVHRYATMDQLDHYCYLVAGTVGLLMARIFGVQSNDALVHAVDLGKAMQVTNILRDVREDMRARDRIYLPLDRMKVHGVSEQDLRAEQASEGLRALVRELSERAEELYRSADKGVPMIVSATGRAATGAMRASYSSILDVIRAWDFDVLRGRAVVPSRVRLFRALGRALRSI